jgi:Zn-dependent protease
MPGSDARRRARAGRGYSTVNVTSPPSSPAARRGRPLVLGRPAHFTLFGIPVRVGAGFLIAAFFFGSQTPSAIAGLVLSAVVFVSILVHELGHALVLRAYGGQPAIELHFFGGLTHLGNLELSRPRHALLSLAGPFAGFALGGVLFAISHAVKLPPMQAGMLAYAWKINFVWGVINLLPVLPFDGGQVLAATLGPRRVLATAVISTVVGVGVAIAGLWLRSPWLAFLFGAAAFSGLGLARRAWEARADVREGLEEAIATAKRFLAEERWDDARTVADDVARRARTLPVRNAGWTALAWAHAGKGEGAQAREALAHVEPRGAVDPYTIAVVEDAAGAPERARGVLDAARELGLRSPEMTRLLVDLHARDGRLDRAIDLAIEDAALLPHDDGRAVLVAAMDGGEYRRAAALADRMFGIFGDPRDVADEARAFALARDAESALKAVTQALAMGALRVEQLAADPAFEPLRQDVRFQALISAST